MTSAPHDRAAEVLAAARVQIEPRVRRWEEAGHADLEVLRQFAADHRLTALHLPAEVGGLELPWTEIVQIARACGRTYRALGFVLVNNVIAGYLHRVGTPDQWAQWGSPIAATRAFSVLSITDSGSGNDVRSIETIADRTATGYRLTGVKGFVPNADAVDMVLVAARVPDEGIAVFAVDRDAPGSKVVRMGDTLALKGVHLCEVHLEGCEVAADNRIGGETSTLRDLTPHLAGSRLNTAGLAIGAAEEALDLAAEYVATTERYGAPLLDLGAVKMRLADLAIETEVATSFLDAAAAAYDSGADYLRRIAMAKVHSTEAALSVTAGALRLMGGWGFLADRKVERLVREASLGPIVDGANDLHRAHIADGTAPR